MARPRFTPVNREDFGTGRWAEDHILDKAGMLEILLEDDLGAKIMVSFETYLAFRKMDEGDAMLTLQDIEESTDIGTMLYRVEDSEYLRWFHFESENARKTHALAHYCLTTIDSVIDVIAFDPPSVSK